MDAVRARVGILVILGLAALVVAGFVVAFMPDTSPTSSRFESQIDPGIVHARNHLARVLAEAEANARLVEREVRWEPERRGCGYSHKELERARARLEEIKRRQRQLREEIRRERIRPEWRLPRLTNRESEACRNNALCREVRR